MAFDINKLLHELYFKNFLEIDKLTYLLKNIDSENKKLLFELACKTKEKYFGKKVFMRGLIEFSNICRQNCLYCGLSSQNKKVERYRLSKEEIIKCCEEGYSLGYRTFVLQSGEDLFYTEERLIEIIKAIKKKFQDTALTLSIGERSEEEYKKFYDSGADRFLLRHETASKSLYEKLHPGMDFENRINCLYILKKIGYQVGAGFMVGLPEQREEDISLDLHFLKKLNPDMIGIGPFIPHSETPLGNETGGTVEQTLIALAVTRLMIPDCLMPATTAMGTLDKNGRELALKAGANVVMPNLTPKLNRAKYQLYENKICLDDDAAQCRKCIEGKIRTAGFDVDMGKGDSVRLRK